MKPHKVDVLRGPIEVRACLLNSAGASVSIDKVWHAKAQRMLSIDFAIVPSRIPPTSGPNSARLSIPQCKNFMFSKLVFEKLHV
jgi:hypothetical protein